MLVKMCLTHRENRRKRFGKMGALDIHESMKKKNNREQKEERKMKEVCLPFSLHFPFYICMGLVEKSDGIVQGVSSYNRTREGQLLGTVIMSA